MSQERVDLPDALNLEAFGNADWAEFVESFFAGDSKAYVVRGFAIPTPSALIGTKATQVTVTCANSMVLHPTSVGGAGAFYSSTGSEPTQSVQLTANQTNYIELDQTTTTSAPDVRAIWDEAGGATGTGASFTQTVDTVTNLKVVMSVNTVSFTAGKVPIAKAVVSSDGTITAITDCRDLFYRLGTGGASPNSSANFDWTAGGGVADPRVQRDNTADATSDPDPFGGSDKIIITLKGWMDAVMSAIKEMRGIDVPYWFSNTTVNTGSTTELYVDSAGSFIKPATDTAFWSVAGSVLTWSQNIDVQSTTGPYYFRILAGNKTLTDGQVIYVSQIRNVSKPNATLFFSWVQNAAYVNGAIGSFTGLESDVTNAQGRGDWVKKAGDSQEKYMRITQFYDAPNGGGATTTAALALSATIVGATGGYQGITGVGSAVDVYAKGGYAVSTPISITDPALTFDADKWWLAVRYGNMFLCRDGVQVADGIDRVINSGVPKWLSGKSNDVTSGAGSALPGISGTGGARTTAGTAGTGGAGVFGQGGAGSGLPLYDGVGVDGVGGGGTADGDGLGSGSGVRGKQGANMPSASAGVFGIGPTATLGVGVRGYGEYGGRFTGALYGVEGTGVTAGIRGNGDTPSGIGVEGNGGSANGIGIKGQGMGTGSGVKGTGGTTGGSMGVEGVGGSTNGVGVKGTGVGTGHGVHGVGVTGHGVVAEGDTTAPAKSALRIVPQDTAPSSPAEGDVYANSTDKRLYCYNGTAWQAISGMEYLGGTKLGAAANSFGNITIPARDILIVVVSSVLTANALIMRFNADSGATYDWIYNTATTANSWSNTLSDSDTSILLGTQDTNPCLTHMVIQNITAARKSVIMTRSRATTTMTAYEGLFRGVWENTTAQITSIEVLSSAAGNSIAADSSILIFGRNA